MRKRTVKNIASTIFWYVLYFLPVLVSIIYFIKASGIDPNGYPIYPQVYDVLLDNGLFIEDGIIFTSLIELFHIDNGILPLLPADYWASYLSWFVSIYLCHIAVDIILFVPKLAHKWMNGLTQQGGDE